MPLASHSKLSAQPPRRNIWPWAILVLALAVRAAYFLAYQQSPYWGVELADQSYYRNWGMRIAHGDWLGTQVFEQGPLYAYLLGIAFRIGLNDGVILALQLLAGATVSLLVYACGHRLFDQTTARVAGILAAIYGPLMHYECMLMKSFLSPVFTMLACYAALKFTERGRHGWLCVAGATIGLASLLTENHILLLIPVGLWCWIGGPAKTSASEKAPFTRRLVSLAVLFASCAAMILPATARNSVVAREFVAVTSGGGEVFYMAWAPFATGNYEPPPFVRSNPYQEHEDFRREARRRTGRDLTHGESSRYWFRQGWQQILADPGRAAKLTTRKAVILFNDFEVPDSEHFQVAREFIPLLYVLPSFGWLAGLGFVGLVLCLRDLRRFVLPLGLLAMHVASVLLTYNFGRFRLGMMPLWILLASFGLVWLVRAWRDCSPTGFPVRLLATIAVVGITAAAFLSSPGVTRDVLAAETQKNRRVLALMSQDRAEAERILAYLAQHPEDFQAHLGAGQLLNKLGKFDEAIDHLSEAVRLDGRHLQARCLISSALLHAGRVGEAVDQLQAASQIRSGSREVGAVSWALVEEQAGALTPEQAETIAVLLEASADAAVKSGKMEEASSFLRSALEAATVVEDPNLVERLQRKKAEYGAGRNGK